MNMKSAPKFDEVAKYRHLLQALLEATEGEGVLQKSWHAAVTNYGKQHLGIDEAEAERASYRTE